MDIRDSTSSKVQKRGPYVVSRRGLMISSSQFHVGTVGLQLAWEDGAGAGPGAEGLVRSVRGLVGGQEAGSGRATPSSVHFCRSGGGNQHFADPRSGPGRP